MCCVSITFSPTEAATPEQPARPASLAAAVKRLDFARTPQKVLDARARLGG